MIAAGAIWIGVIAIQNDEVIWGVASIVCGIAAIIYGVQNFEQSKIPLSLLILGIGVEIAGRLMNLVTRY